ncbi:MAG: sigma-70 family RNA polymerase sigma factor [Litoreibacter sp.]
MAAIDGGWALERLPFKTISLLVAQRCFRQIPSSLSYLQKMSRLECLANSCLRVTASDDTEGSILTKDENELIIEQLPQFVREHSDWMLAVAYRILLDRSLAEDVVQTAFSKIFAKLDTFEGRSKLRTWMHRIVTNEALMMLRKIKRRNEQSIDELLPVFDGGGCRVEFEQGDSSTPENLLSRRETHDQIRHAIMSLPEKYRIVLCLRDIEGLSTIEVGNALELSEANVKVRLHRARAALKKLLEPHIREQKL